MQLQEVINNIFRQDFQDPAVLGRTLYGAAVFVLGSDLILRATGYASLAPAYIPFATGLTALLGTLLFLAGLLIVANSHLRTATTLLVSVLALLVLVIFLPQGNVSEIMQVLAVIGGALVIRSFATSNLDRADDE